MMREFPSLIARCCTDSEDREEVSGLTNSGCSYLYWLDSWKFESLLGVLGKLANYVNLTVKFKSKTAKRTSMLTNYKSLVWAERFIIFFV